MPDQYTLAALQRLELERPNRASVMAEIDLVSSHTPWAPLPRLVDWSRVGDGSVFDPMPAEGKAPEEVWRDPDLVKAAYAESVAYSLDAVTSFVQQLHDQDLVLVVLGDHQPARIVPGGRKLEKLAAAGKLVKKDEDGASAYYPVFAAFRSSCGRPA
jgi:hypothetical protein